MKATVLLTALVSAALAAPLSAATEAEAAAGREIVKKNADAIVSVELVVNGGAGGRGGRGSAEQKVEVNATVISPTGLTVTSLTAIDPRVGRGRGSSDNSDSEFKEVKLRLADNTALRRALASSHEVVTAFIVDDVQVAAHPHRSVNGLAFMIESLEELNDALVARGGRLLLLQGSPAAVVDSVIATLGIDAVFFNRDYTPFSLHRDAAIADVCARAGVPCLTSDDALLVDPQTFAKDDGRPYTVFTPFYRKASQREVRTPTGEPVGRCSPADDYHGPLADLRSFWPDATAPSRVSRGGRSRALAILKTIRTFADYERHRDLPAERGTTHLAPHHKFGTISIRETYHAVASTFSAGHTLVQIGRAHV